MKKTDYGQEEAAAKQGSDPRVFTTTVKELIADKDGKLSKVVTVKLEPKVDKKTGRTQMVPVDGTEETLSCQLLLIAAGFLGPEGYIAQAFGVEQDARSNVKTDNAYTTSVPGVFAAGDARRGQSLVVWAIREGRECAREVDRHLRGYTNL